MKYKPDRDLPEFARQFKTLKPSQLVAYILAKRNIEVTPESVTMWFKRHPAVYEELSQEIIQGLPTEKQAVDRSIFLNGNFKELASIQNWIKELTVKNAKPKTINIFTAYVRRVCQGEVRQGEFIENWTLKHPDRLTLEDGKDFLYEVKKRGYKTRGWRTALRNFLMSKGQIIRSSDISGELEEDAGQYADLFVAREKIYELLANIKQRNLMAYRASFFSFKTASRLTATLEADAQYINHTEFKITVFEKSQKGKGKKRVIKLLSEDLWKELDLDRAQSRLFPIEPVELNTVIREAMKEVIPELEPRIKMPFHFWRHMFAQHMLRAMDWNLGFVARLGNWSVEALERYYGKADQQTIDKAGRKIIPTI